MATAKLNAGGNPAMDRFLIQVGVEIILDATYYRNRNNFQADGSLGSYTDLTFTLLTNLTPEKAKFKFKDTT